MGFRLIAATDLSPVFGEELVQSLDQEDAEGAVGGGLTLLTVEDIKSETLNQTKEPFEVRPVKLTLSAVAADWTASWTRYWSSFSCCPSSELQRPIILQTSAGFCKEVRGAVGYQWWLRPS